MPLKKTKKRRQKHQRKHAKIFKEPRKLLSLDDMPLKKSRKRREKTSEKTDQDS
jgi:hypothetical protein